MFSKAIQEAKLQTKNRRQQLGLNNAEGDEKEEGNRGRKRKAKAKAAPKAKGKQSTPDGEVDKEGAPEDNPSKEEKDSGETQTEKWWEAGGRHGAGFSGFLNWASNVDILNCPPVEGMHSDCPTKSYLSDACWCPSSGQISTMVPEHATPSKSGSQSSGAFTTASTCTNLWQDSWSVENDRLAISCR